MSNSLYLHMPKIELHCHLDGSLPLATIQKLAHKSNISLPQTQEELLQITSVQSTCKSLREYLTCFTLPIACLQTAENIHIATYELLQAAANENVIYMEIRFAPLLFMQKGLKAEAVVEAVLEGISAAKNSFGIEAAAILCAMRHQPPQQNLPLVHLAEKYRLQGVAGLDLAGDEKAYPAKQHSTLFEQAATAKIPYTIHAGEADGAHSVAAAIDLGAKRIGHGIAMKDAPNIIEKCLSQKIAIEMCPTSNIHTKAAAGWQNYPFQKFYDKGLIVTINTDNRTVSNTSLTQEFEQLESAFHITHADAKKLSENAVESSFASTPQKQKMHALIQGFHNKQQRKVPGNTHK